MWCWQEMLLKLDIRTARRQVLFQPIHLEAPKQPGGFEWNRLEVWSLYLRNACTSIQRPGSISQMSHWRLGWCQSSVHPWHPLLFGEGKTLVAFWNRGWHTHTWKHTRTPACKHTDIDMFYHFHTYMGGKHANNTFFCWPWKWRLRTLNGLRWRIRSWTWISWFSLA